MGTFRVLLCTAALLSAATVLRAAQDTGQWGCGIGVALPSGDTKKWVGTTTGADLDITQTFALGADDAIRMRFGFFTFKGSSTNPVTLVLPGGTVPETFPASTTNQLFAFSYGAEYVRALPARLYVLGGLGVNYVTATRSGTFDFTSAGTGTVPARYDANNFVPYVCLGLGVQLGSNVALEARWQTTSMKSQTRYVDLSNGGVGPYTTPGKVYLDKMNPAEFSIGLALTF